MSILLRRPLALVAAVLVAAASADTAVAQKPAAPKFDRGKIVDGKASNGVTWHVRLPKEWDFKRGGPAILILHGSNMNSSAYVNTIAAAFPKLAEEFAVVGIDGEQRVRGSPDSDPAFNYTYGNWTAKSDERASPVLVTEALTEIRKSLVFTKVFVGGHSQGGFLTYSLFMNFPEVFAGAFPISCGLITQREPSAFDDAAHRARQRQGALAIVHARDDPIVKFSQGDDAHDAFLDDGFPALKFFDPPAGAHMFAMLPVEPAVRWLDDMTEEDPPKLATILRRRLEAKEWRDVAVVMERLKRFDVKRAHVAAVETAQKAFEGNAAARAKDVQKSMSTAKADGWVQDFLSFRQAFESADAAKRLMAGYRTMRESQEKQAEKLWKEARELWEKKDNAAAKYKCIELVKSCPATRQYKWAKNALR